MFNKKFRVTNKTLQIIILITITTTTTATTTHIWHVIMKKKTNRYVCVLCRECSEEAEEEKGQRSVLFPSNSEAFASRTQNAGE